MQFAYQRLYSTNGKPPQDRKINCSKSQQERFRFYFLSTRTTFITRTVLGYTTKHRYLIYTEADKTTDKGRVTRGLCERNKESKPGKRSRIKKSCDTGVQKKLCRPISGEKNGW